LHCDAGFSLRNFQSTLGVKRFDVGIDHCHMDLRLGGACISQENSGNFKWLTIAAWQFFAA
jgi:hypothetical protein